MSKALVIKGANFAANKVETIAISEPIPCTGLSVSPTTIAFTEINSTQQITVTKTPADTTDSVSYVSSNESVATVSSSGLVTCVGIGSATITVMCGEQSVACAVTAVETIIINNALTYESGKMYSSSIDLANNKNWIGKTDGSRGKIFYSTEDALGGYRAFIKTEYAGQYLVPLPKGATHASATVPNGITLCSLILADSNTKSNASGADGRCASAVHAPYSVLNQTQDISGTTANGWLLYVFCASGTDIETITGDIVLTFS